MDRKFYTCLLLLGFVLHIALTFPSGEIEDLEEDDTQQQQQQSVDSESLAAFASSIKSPVKGTRRGEKLKTKSAEESSDPCLESKRIGRCRAHLPRYYFDQKEGGCKRFGFGGCDSNRNNFEDLTTCESTCAKHLKVISLTSTAGEERTVTPISNIISPSPSVCTLPSEIGFCYAIQYKYFFNKENNRCERFEYGGCGGNGNRFNSAEECIRTCGGDSPGDNPICSKISCPWSLYTHYKTLGCTAIYDGDACCPTRFDCPDQVQSNNTIDEGRSSRSRPGPQPEPIVEIVVAESQPKCSYKGKLYNVGEMVNEASDSGSCRADCYCSHRQMQGPQIACASIECPEHLGGIPPAKVGCLPLYKRGSCCAYDFYCPNDTLTIITPQLPEGEPTTTTNAEVVQCEVDGKKYYAGQRFYPEDSPCLKCLCQKGYNGSLTDEFCENIDCGIEIHYSDYLARGCAPVYFQTPQGKSRCCPVSWECPEDNHQSTESAPTSTTPTQPGTGSPLMVLPSLVTPVPSEGNRSSRHYLTDEVCQLPKSVGVCKAIRLRYFYNKDTKACEEFTYTGCQGNDNNFASIRDCQGLCVTSNTASPGDNQPLGRGLDLTQARPQQPRGIYLSEQDPCTMAMKVGICKGYFPRYYYSPEDNHCKPFIFGGCRGNGNNFYSKESCEATCTNSIPVQSLRSINSGGPTKSEGDASMVKFGEDVPSTDGSSTTWESTDPCTLPRLTGRCKGFFQRFFYDSQTGKCKEFVYGGCGGNDNNFSNMRSCERRCAARGSQSRIFQIQPQPTTTSPNGLNTDEPNGQEIKPPPFGFLERCNLPMKTGPCYGNITAYYYDIDSKSCKSFVYGGCGGNANKFSSLVECEQVCKIPGISTSRRTSQPDAEFIRDDNCNLPPKEGNCKGSYLRFHWDQTLEQCLPFNYSGCGENKNNFISESDCITVCGKQPTIEELNSEGVLSCNFGTETLPIGSTVGGFKYSSEDIPCGVPVCQCLTPPSVTCIQTMCPLPTTPQPVTSASNICILPTCDSHCSQVDGPDGCPVCDCDDEHESQQQVVQEDFPVKSVKG